LAALVKDWEGQMKANLTTLLLASVFAINAGAAVAKNLPVEQSDGPRAWWYHTPVPVDHRPEWYQRWLLKRLYHQPPGYAPDYRTCFPGACRDNPYY
jgi:hypothetical protein